MVHLLLKIDAEDDKMVSMPQAVIFNVQRFSVHDGPGIRTTVFFKGCPLRCRWCQNPESLAPGPELAFYAERCQATGDCLAACPHAALRPGSERPGGERPGSERVVRESCDACGECVERCPYRALRVIGRTVSLEDLVAEVARDRPFYRSSGGGVTLSGGEATLQMDFIVAFAARCQEMGIDVALQTCGAFGWESLAPHLERFELIHFDLKVMDSEVHRRLTGAVNRTILDNARRLAAAGAPVRFRMPVIPEHTDDEPNLRRIAAFLTELGVPRLDLLAYHRMGEVKSARLGWPLPSLGLADPSRARASLERAAAVLAREGIAVVGAES